MFMAYSQHVRVTKENLICEYQFQKYLISVSTFTTKVAEANVWLLQYSMLTVFTSFYFVSWGLITNQYKSTLRKQET